MPFASIGTQNAVPNRVVFCCTIGGTSSSSRRSSVIGMQINPRPYVAMKLIDLRRHLLRRNGQIPFVLAVLVVDDDDHLAVANGVDRVLDGGERLMRFSRSSWP